MASPNSTNDPVSFVDKWTAAFKSKWSGAANDAQQSPSSSSTPVSPTSEVGMRTQIAKAIQLREINRIKIKAARSHILLLLACLAYIVTIFAALGVGLQEISLFLQPTLERVHVELRAQGNVWRREQSLNEKLEKLLDTRLGRGFGETYEDCLVRGLQEANSHFTGLGFQYSDIRNQSMQWTTQNCMRLMYVPQPQHPSPQQAILTRWARTTYRARRVFEKTIDMIASGWYKMVSVLGIRPEKPAQISSHAKAPRRDRVRSQMPFGFALNCTGPGLCRLAYPETYGTADKIPISRDELQTHFHDLEILFWFCAKLKSFHGIMMPLAWFFTSLMALPMIIYAVARYHLAICMPHPQIEDLKAWRPTHGDVDRLHEEMRYTMLSFLWQVSAMLLHSIMQREPCHDCDSVVALVFGVAMLFCGTSMAINFFSPISLQVERFSEMRDAVKELYRMVGVELAQAFPSTAPGQKQNSTWWAFFTLNQPSANTAAPAVQPVAPVEPRAEYAESYASLDVNLFVAGEEADVGMPEDVEYTVHLKQIHESAVETNSDSEFDGEQYVDLAGNITPESGSDDDLVVDA